MNNYLIVIAGFAVGQIFHAAYATWKLQKENDKLEWKEALWLYIKKGQGAFAMAMASLLAVLFLFPEIKDKGKILENIRYYSLVFGVFAQWIGSLAFGVGKKVLEAKAKADGVEFKSE